MYSDKTKARIIKEINDMKQNLETIQQMVETDTLETYMKEMLFQNLDYNHAHLAELVGFHSLSNDVLDEKHREVQKLRQEVIELKERLPK